LRYYNIFFSDDLFQYFGIIGKMYIVHVIYLQETWHLVKKKITLSKKNFQWDGLMFAED
jgi:hypothetical protein